MGPGQNKIGAILVQPRQPVMQIKTGAGIIVWAGFIFCQQRFVLVYQLLPFGQRTVAPGGGGFGGAGRGAAGQSQIKNAAVPGEDVGRFQGQFAPKLWLYP